MSLHVFRLVTLGRLALLGPGGHEDESLAKRRRKLALLAVLSLSDRPLARDQLAEMFWGDEDEERARHSLSDALSHLRRVLGRDAITARREEVSLGLGERLVVDARELAAAAAARVVELYTGPFLDAVYVPGSPSFDQWVTRERARLERLFVKACEVQCLALARARKWDECEALARRWLTAMPLSADGALYLLNAVKAAGTREADARALDEYRRLSEHLRREYDTAPEDRVTALADEIARRLRETPSLGRVAADRAPPAAQPVAVEPTSAAVAPLPDAGRAEALPRSDLPKLRRFARLAAAGVVVAVAVASYSWRHLAAHPTPPLPGKPAVAVVALQVLSGDTSSVWLEHGMKQMIASELARSGVVAVVPPSKLREAESRDAARPLGLPEVLAVGRQAGATWVMTGGLTRSDTLYALDVALYDVRTAKVLRLYTVAGPTLAVLADRAASGVLGLAEGGDGHPGFADVATSSIEAYQH